MSKDKSRENAFRYGRAYHELKDNPYFESIMELLESVKTSAQLSLYTIDPSNMASSSVFKDTVAHVIGQAAGLDRFMMLLNECEEEYLTNQTEEEEYD